MWPSQNIWTFHSSPFYKNILKTFKLEEIENNIWYRLIFSESLFWLPIYQIISTKILHSSKVFTFWEANKILCNHPHALYIYLLNIQTIRKIFSNFVCFSESPNFNRDSSDFLTCLWLWFRAPSKSNKLNLKKCTRW